MKAVQRLALLAVLACAQASAPAQPGPAAAAASPGPTAEQAAIMDRIEREVRLPAGAGPLGAYERYYALHQDDRGTRVVAAIYVRGGTPGRRWVEETGQPMIADGGCDVIEVIYDLTTQRIQTVACNGVA